MPETLIVAVIADGYLAGASCHPRARLESYWPDLRYEEGFALYRLEGVPADLAADLLAHGSYSQVFRDGYEAWQAAAPYLAEEPERIHGTVGP